jgi:hypothetical protein
MRHRTGWQENGRFGPSVRVRQRVRGATLVRSFVKNVSLACGLSSRVPDRRVLQDATLQILVPQPYGLGFGSCGRPARRHDLSQECYLSVVRLSQRWLPPCRGGCSPFSNPHSPQPFSHSVFLAEVVFSPFFFPTQPAPSQPVLFQRCSLSRVCDERGKTAPLTCPRR